MGGPAAKESAVISQVHAYTHLGAQDCCQVGCQLWALCLGRLGVCSGPTGLLSARAFQVRPGQPASLAAALNLHLGRLGTTGHPTGPTSRLAALNLHLGRLGPTGRLGARLGPTGRLANAITVTKHAPI